jgi:hypothetical protein
MTIPVKARRDGSTVVALGEFESGDRIPPEHVETLMGAASSLDANGNPTPVAAASDYPANTLLYATSYPSAQNNGTGVSTSFDGGDMVFRRTGSTGSEAWTWFGGSFRASNSNGNYQRDADGTQRLSGQASGSTVTTEQFLTIDPALPAAFVSIDFQLIAQPLDNAPTAADQPTVYRSKSLTVGTGRVSLATNHGGNWGSAGTLAITYVAEGKWQ